MASAPSPPSPASASIWRAPLVPAALAVTAGIVVDRYAAVPVTVSLLVAAVALAALVCVRAGPRGLCGR